MPDDPIDRALRDQPEIAPSPELARRVMRAVRHEAAQRQGLPFPWHLAGGGVAIAAGLTLAALLGGGLTAPAAAPPAPPAWLAPAVAWLASTLVASLGLAWGAVRLAARW